MAGADTSKIFPLPKAKFALISYRSIKSDNSDLNVVHVQDELCVYMLECTSSSIIYHNNLHL